MLVTMCETVQQEIFRDHTEPVLRDLSKDYLGAMLGRDVGEAKLSSAEIDMRARVKDVLVSNDAMFSSVGEEVAVEAGGEGEGVKPEVDIDDEESMLQAQLLEEM